VAALTEILNSYLPIHSLKYIKRRFAQPDLIMLMERQMTAITMRIFTQTASLHFAGTAVAF